MENVKLLKFSEMPKWFRAFFFFAPLVVVFGITRRLDNDFYFLYPTGEYIINNGFPVTDFLSMHSSMHIIVQQWLTTVLFYYIYKYFGTVGMLAFVYICYFIFAVICYKLMMLVTDNNQFISTLCAFTSDLIIGWLYMRTRPQIITFIIIASELYLLEKYVKEGKNKYLILLPIFSLFVINAHSSMWLMLFVFAAPFVFNAIPFKFKKIKQEPCCKLLPLVITGAICFAVGFLNPYGIKAMTYIFSSFGYDEISNYIHEMQAFSLRSVTKYIFVPQLLIMLVTALVMKEKHFRSRFVLLFAGTLLLGLMNIKAFAYFAIAGVFSFAYLVKDIEPTFKITESKGTKNEKLKRILLGVLIVAVAVSGAVFLTMPDSSNNTEKSAGDEASDYAAMDDISDILKKEKGDIVLYAGFDHGQYMEYLGYHPYIDGRAELFLKDNNDEYDYMKEFNKMYYGGLFYKDFVNRYDFNYLVVDKKEHTLFEGLKQDKDYELLYKSKNIYLFHLK